VTYGRIPPGFLCLRTCAAFRLLSHRLQGSVLVGGCLMQTPRGAASPVPRWAYRRAASRDKLMPALRRHGAARGRTAAFAGAMRDRRRRAVAGSGGTPDGAGGTSGGGVLAPHRASKTGAAGRLSPRGNCILLLCVPAVPAAGAPGTFSNIRAKGLEWGTKRARLRRMA